MFSTPCLCYVEVTTRRAWARMHGDQRGEGVVSVAIAVLIMAFLGAIMFAGFKLTLGKAQSRTDCQVSGISVDSGAAPPSC